MRWQNRTRWLATRPRWLRVSLAIVVGVVAAPFVLVALVVGSVIFGYVKEHVALVREMWREHPYGYSRSTAAKEGRTGMTITEMRAARKNLEAVLSSNIRAFEAATGLKVTGLTIFRESAQLKSGAADLPARLLASVVTAVELD